MNEIRVINGFVKYFLPNYGPSIENLILYGSLTINDNTVRLNRIYTQKKDALRKKTISPFTFSIKLFIIGTKNL